MENFKKQKYNFWIGYIAQDKNHDIHYGSFPCLVVCNAKNFPSITEFNELAKSYVENVGNFNPNYVNIPEINKISVISCGEKTKKEIYCLYPLIRTNKDLMQIYI